MSKYNILSIYKKCEVKNWGDGGDIVLTVASSERQVHDRQQAWESTGAGGRLGNGD